ncbi:MAG TPA: hypothetical protein VKR31_11385 [Rhizomicrobium sp.]|nr:hypothetical protein [Rhizomicrobium sp.]
MRVHVMALAAALAMPGSSALKTHRPAAGPSSPRTPAVAVSGSCSFKTTDVAAAASFDQSTSTRYVNLHEGGSITFRQTRMGCVAGSFFANAGNADATDHVLLQVLLDGTACAPLTGGYIFANSSDDFSSHSAGFFCGAKIAPGKHTIQVQYASGLGGDSQLFQRTLQVSHE